MKFEFGPFILDLTRRQLARDGAEHRLTPKAFELLAFLVREAPRVVAKHELHRQLWPRTVVTDATLVGLVKEIRRALGDRDPAARIIRTVNRVGYTVATNVTRIAEGQVPVLHWLVVGGSRFALTEGRNLIGRDASASVRLDSPTVSRCHASIVVDLQRAVLEDNDSKNGTRIGSQTVVTPTTLRDGDTLSFGSVTGTYRRLTAAAATITQIGAPVSRR